MRKDYGTEFWAAGQIPGSMMQTYATRALSDDGSRLFFESFDPLVLRDTNAKKDVYQWEAAGAGSCKEGSPSFSPPAGGCVSLISSGDSPLDSEFIDASPSGNDVFFRTGSSLLPSDPGLFDIYDARVGGGFPQPVVKAPCEGDACQSPPSQPAALTPASSAFYGQGNAKPSRKPRCAKGKRRVTRNGKARCAKRSQRGQRRAQRNQGRAQR